MFRISKLSAMLLATTLLTACSSVTENGGTAGALQDRVVFKARNDAEYVYRALSVAAALAAAAEVNPHVINNPGNTRQVIAQLNGVVHTLSTMNQLAYSACGGPTYVQTVIGETVSVGKCDKTALYRTRFQSLTASVDRQLLNLAATALPIEGYNKVNDAIISGSYWEIVTSILPMIVTALDMGNEMAGVSRERRQGYAYMNAKQGSTLSSSSTDDLPLSYTEALALPQDPAKKFQPKAMEHYSAATFYTLAQSCLNMRGHLSLDDQRTADVAKNQYVLYENGGPSIKAGISNNNCPDSYHTGTAVLSVYAPQTYSTEPHAFIDGLDGKQQTLPQ